MNKILLINGPNLNLLGEREPELYGSTTLQDIEELLRSKAEEKGCSLLSFQSNHEGAIVDFIHQHCNSESGVIINAGAYTHTSIAIRDALLARKAPVVEVHLSNIYQRESFRHKSYLSDIAFGMITGLGVAGYEYALDFLVRNSQKSRSHT